LDRWLAIPVLIAHGILMGWINREEELLDQGGLFIVMEHSARAGAEEREKSR
jgi:hypothetical protein